MGIKEVDAAYNGEAPYEKTIDGIDYVIQEFKKSGTFIVPRDVEKVDITAVGGGSGGDSGYNDYNGRVNGGYGGSGGRINTSTNINMSSYSSLIITIGTGGAGGVGTFASGDYQSSSVNWEGRDGSEGGVSTVKYGTTTIITSSNGMYGGSGRWGAWFAVLNGANYDSAGSGMAGVKAINNIVYGGGGGGGGIYGIWQGNGSKTLFPGNGGDGGGAQGGTNPPRSTVGVAPSGVANTGGGGGGGGGYWYKEKIGRTAYGSWGSGGKGGSGIVIIRWEGRLNESPTLTLTQPTSNSPLQYISDCTKEVA